MILNWIKVLSFFSRHPIIIFYAVSLHVTWGVILLVNDEIYHTTAIDETYKLIGTNPVINGIFFILIGVSAIMPLMLKVHPVLAVLLTIPQQTILVISSIGVLTAVINQHYADMVLRSWGFILLDKCDMPLATFWHTIAIFQRYIFYKNDLSSWYKKFC